jgi:hypothetical protein
MGGLAATVLLGSCAHPNPYWAAEAEKQRAAKQAADRAAAEARIQTYVGRDYWVERTNRLLVCQKMHDFGNCASRSGHFKVEGFNNLTDSSLSLRVTFDGAPTGWTVISPGAMQAKFQTLEPSPEVTVYPSFLDSLPRKTANERRKLPGVALGMDRGDVLTSAWGVPLDRKILGTRKGLREVWRYSQDNVLYFRDGVLDAFEK